MHLDPGVVDAAQALGDAEQERHDEHHLQMPEDGSYMYICVCIYIYIYILILIKRLILSIIVSNNNEPAPNFSS